MPLSVDAYLEKMRAAFRTSGQNAADPPSATGWALRRFAGLTIVFLTALFLFAVAQSLDAKAFLHFTRTLAIGMAAFSAAFACGAGLGFVFAIPRAATPQDAQQSPPTGTQTAESTNQNEHGQTSLRLTLFGSNSNLEKVSDWLTTILVGISLTQFDAIAHRLDRAGFTLSCAMATGTHLTCAEDHSVIGHVIIIFGGALGFLVVYLWTRRYLIIEWTRGITEALDVERRALASEIRDNAVASGQIGGPRLAATPLHTESAAEQARPSSAIPESIVRRIVAEEGLLLPPPLKWEKIFPLLSEPTDAAPDDPWKQRFGGTPVKNGYSVLAFVSPSAVVGIAHSVRITITRPRDSIASVLRIFQHPTFRTVTRTTNFDDSGLAKIDLLSYGAFTIGVAIADPKAPDAILLELDLANVDAPEDFKQR